jgi:CRISPR-associated protein Csm2
MYQKTQKEENDVKKIKNEINQLAMFKDLDVKKFTIENGYADILAKTVKIKTTQLRRFFNEIKQIEKRLSGGASWSDIETDFYLLRPRLAYAKGRELISKDFYELVKTALIKVDVGKDHDKKENFEKFVKFLEAMVAYHKFYNP